MHGALHRAVFTVHIVIGGAGVLESNKVGQSENPYWSLRLRMYVICQVAEPRLTLPQCSSGKAKAVTTT